MPEIKITEKTISKPAAPTSLKLPPIAWRGIFKDYLDMVGDTTEAADVFHYATFLQVLGCTLGRRLFVYHATRLYPNFYTCLVGRSGLTRKDTTWSRGRQVLDRLNENSENDPNPPFKMFRGIRSFEGLLDELAGERKIRLIQFGEFLSLLARSKQESGGTAIIPALTELYDSPDKLNPPVHQKDVKVAVEPFLSIMAGTTQDWLQKGLTERDIYGGFANRWLYFYGFPKGPIPSPPRVDPEKRNKLIQDLNMIRSWANDVSGGEIKIEDDAEALFADYYQGYYWRCQQPGLLPTLAVRVQDFIWKIALLYAADSMSETISKDHLEAAIEVGNYLEASAAEVFSGFGDTSGKAQETKLLELLRSDGGQPVPEREIYRRIKLSAKELAVTIEPLLKLGMVRCTYITASNHKKVKTYEVVE
jgi:hypothetical protein